MGDGKEKMGGSPMIHAGMQDHVTTEMADAVDPLNEDAQRGPGGYDLPEGFVLAQEAQRPEAAPNPADGLLDPGDIAPAAFPRNPSAPPAIKVAPRAESPRAAPAPAASPVAQIKPISSPRPAVTTNNPIVPVPAQPLPRPEINLDQYVSGTLLIVNDDVVAGAQTAARLLERGYSCRAVPFARAPNLLREEKYDAAIVEVDAELLHREARRERGETVEGEGVIELLVALSDYSGSVLLVSTAPFQNSFSSAPVRVVGVFTRPFFIDDVQHAIERSNRTDMARSRTHSVILDPVEAIADIELDTNIVRALVTQRDGAPSRGRVRTMSYEGDLTIECNTRLESDAKVAVELTIVNGRRMEFPATIIDSGPRSLHIRVGLRRSDHRRFLRTFLSEARNPSVPLIELVRIREVDPDGLEPEQVEDRLAKKWAESSQRMDNDEAQQVFIQECIKYERVEYGVRCYREFKKANSGDENADRYLKQLGTILGFYALKKENQQIDTPLVPKTIKILLALFVLAGIIAWVVVELLGPGS